MGNVEQKKFKFYNFQTIIDVFTHHLNEMNTHSLQQQHRWQFDQQFTEYYTTSDYTNKVICIISLIIKIGNYTSKTKLTNQLTLND